MHSFYYILKTHDLCLSCYFCNKIYGFYSLKIITLWNFNMDFIANGNYLALIIKLLN